LYRKWDNKKFKILSVTNQIPTVSDVLSYTLQAKGFGIGWSETIGDFDRDGGELDTID
jgi:hypothetical protein